MTISEARKKLEQLENDLQYYLSEKERLMPLPKASDITQEKVEGGKRTDKLLEYVETIEIKELDKKILSLQERIENLVIWIETELKILGKYDPLKREIVTLREEYKLTYDQIGQRVGYSDRQIRRIYKSAIGHRDIW